VSITTHTYSKLGLSLATKKLDLSSDTIKAMLLSAYTVGSTIDSAQYLADVLAVATEASGGGYTAGGITLPSRTFTASSHDYVLSSAAITFGTGTSAVGVVFYDSTPGSNATDPVIAYWDFGGTTSVTTLTPDATGIYILRGTG
jgi:hypothetical protein